MIPPKSLVRRTGWPESASKPLVTPLQPSVVYTSGNPDALDVIYTEKTGFSYAREGHPNASVLASKIDYLEGTQGGIITGSGMSAISAVLLGVLKAGDHVLCGDQAYGRTLRLMTQDLPRLGIETSLADPTDAAAIRAAMRPNTRMILVEVISNPTIRVADMEGIARISSETGVLLVVDNTFTTPRLYRPFEHGADIIIHSVTKLMAGHSDATLGYAVARDPALMTAINDQGNPPETRIVAICNLQEQDKTCESVLRPDLFYRLAAMRIIVPPLRQRGEDVLTLFAALSDQFAEEYGCDAPQVTAQEAAQLLQAPWPGNVRQMVNIAERAVLQNRRGSGSIASLLMADNEASGPALTTEGKPLKDYVEAFERMLIDNTMRRHKGSIVAVMDELCLPRRTLNEKMAKYNLQRSDYL